MGRPAILWRLEVVMGAYGDTAYGAQVKQFKDLEGTLNKGMAGAQAAYGQQQKTVNSMEGNFAAAQQAGKQALRASGSNALAAAGAPAAQAGSGGYGALLQAGQSGGIAEAKFGADSSIDAAKAMMAGQQQLGQSASSLAGLASSNYDAIQEAGGSIERMDAEAYDSAAAAMDAAFEKYDGVYNTDDEESGFEAAIVSAINSAESPEVRKRLIALAIQYRHDFYNTFEKDNDEKFRKQNE
jgi:hypothetical protein